MRVRDADRVAGPLEQLDVVLAVAERDRLRAREAEQARQELESRPLRDVRMRELEEVRQRLRDVETAVEALLHAHLQIVELQRIADGDELRRRLVEPRKEVADRVDGELLEACIRLRLGSLAYNVELVVDVDVQREALRLDGGDRLARELERDRHVAQELARVRAGDD